MTVRTDAESRRVGNWADPSITLLIVACLSLGVLGPTSARYDSLVAGGYLWWTLAARVQLRPLLRKMAGASLFLAVIVVIDGATGGGRILFDVAGMRVTRDGLTEGAVQCCRLLLVLWGSWLLVSTTPIEGFLDVAERWMERKGRPVLAAGAVTLIYLPLLVGSARRVMIARRARGVRESKRFFSGIVSASRASLPMFGAALRNADALADAMESRCYATTAPRTRFSARPISARGVAILACCLCLTLISLIGIL